MRSWVRIPSFSWMFPQAALVRPCIHQVLSIIVTRICKISTAQEAKFKIRCRGTENEDWIQKLRPRRLGRQSRRDLKPFGHWNQILKSCLVYGYLSTAFCAVLWSRIPCNCLIVYFISRTSYLYKNTETYTTKWTKPRTEMWLQSEGVAQHR